MSDDEFDNIPDDFADIPDVDWAQLLAGPAPQAAASTHNERQEQDAVPGPSNQNRPASNDSSLYFPDDDMDSAFLAELDQVEQRVTGGSQVPSVHPLNGGLPQVRTASRNGETSSSTHMSSAVVPQPQIQSVSETRSSRRFQNQAAGRISSPNSKKIEALLEKDLTQTSTIPFKRVHSTDSSDVISPKRKGKMKAANDLQQILSGYEDELTCPICCDLLVASHVGNPCGHTFCGDCGWQWHVQNKKKACPFCRMTLDENVPMIPNIAMDNTVEKHVKALAQSGMREWEPGGENHRERNARKQAWRDGAGKRDQKKKARRPMKPPPQPHLFDLFEVPHNWIQLAENVDEQDPDYVDPDYVDSDIELIPRPIQRARRRR